MNKYYPLAELIKEIAERRGIRTFEELEELFPSSIIAQTGRGHIVYDLRVADPEDSYVKTVVKIDINGMEIGVITAWECWKDHRDDLINYMRTTYQFRKEEIEKAIRILDSLQ